MYFTLQCPSASAVTAPIRDQMRKEAESILDGARRQTVQKDVEFKEKTSSGNAGSTIAVTADSNKFDLIVIGSIGISGAKGMFFGSVSNHVIHASKTPVLLVK